MEDEYMDTRFVRSFAEYLINKAAIIFSKSGKKCYYGKVLAHI